ncbi:MAG: GNAT family N-acetyltransferase [Phycisphaerales bacterium]|jgi:GNAT superfamily N-acetyltransferase|nr:GNAT family N-acetyltransferase [Phycisphaerales bacterium]
MSPVADVRILSPATGLAAACEPILRSLPEWFGIESSIIEYVEKIEQLPTTLAMHRDEAIGFLTIDQHFPSSSELHVLGVRPEWHRKGVGRLLLAEAERHVRRTGGRYLQVKTLSPRRICEHYERTRRWYEAMGFSPLTEFPTLWDEANPCLQMIKVLD